MSCFILCLAKEFCFRLLFILEECDAEMWKYISLFKKKSKFEKT